MAEQLFLSYGGEPWCWPSILFHLPASILLPCRCHLYPTQRRLSGGEELSPLPPVRITLHQSSGHVTPFWPMRCKIKSSGRGFWEKSLEPQWETSCELRAAGNTACAILLCSEVETLWTKLRAGTWKVPATGLEPLNHPSGALLHLSTPRYVRQYCLFPPILSNTFPFYR